jgi:4-hydroxy-3-polyprenylbenzoate decarboxylase
MFVRATIEAGPVRPALNFGGGAHGMDARRRRLVVGVSGASGVLYGVRVLDACRELGVETHLVVSRAALLTLAQETDLSPADLTAKAWTSYRVGDVGAPIASGSFPTLGMIVAPCSVRTMSEIATGVTSSLLTRAADVTLKERRPLVLMVRETPLHLGHLRTMVQLAEMGATLAPPLPAFYTRPRDLAEMVDQSVGRTLDLFGLAWSAVRRWGDDIPASPATDPVPDRTA